MAKPDGRVEAGQSLKRAISAQRWNDLCDSADIVHGRRGGIKADPAKFKGLPCQIGKFDLPNFATNNFGHAYVVNWDSELSTEGQIPSAIYPEVVVAPVSLTSLGVGLSAQATRSIVIGHPSGGANFVWSGYAAALVQVTNYSHKYAREPIATEQGQFLPGRLQSSHYGPVKIIGYFSLENAETAGLTAEPDTSTTIVWPNYELVWALVCL